MKNLTSGFRASLGCAARERPTGEARERDAGRERDLEARERPRCRARESLRCAARASSRCAARGERRNLPAWTSYRHRVAQRGRTRNATGRTQNETTRTRMRRHEREVRRHERKMRRHEREMRRHERELRQNERKMRRVEREMRGAGTKPGASLPALHGAVRHEATYRRCVSGAWRSAGGESWNKPTSVAWTRRGGLAWRAWPEGVAWRSVAVCARVAIRRRAVVAGGGRRMARGAGPRARTRQTRADGPGRTPASSRRA